VNVNKVVITNQLNYDDYVKDIKHKIARACWNVAKETAKIYLS